MQNIFKFSEFINEQIAIDHKSLNNHNRNLSENMVSTRDGEFWGSVGAGVLPICLKTKRILIPLRSPNVQEPNTYGVWGGKMDDGDGEDVYKIEDVVKRELYEETQYSGDIKLIKSYVYQTKHREFTYYNFIGLIDDEFTPRLNWETSSAKWVTLDELLKIKHKHFGLISLIENDLNTIKQYAE